MLTSLKIVEKSIGVSDHVSAQVRASIVDTQVAYTAWAKTVVRIGNPIIIQSKRQVWLPLEQHIEEVS